MRRGKREREHMGPAAAALRRNRVFRDARATSGQLSASQLLADAQELQRSTGPSNDITTVVINTPEELALYRQKTRTELEERVKRGYAFLGNWVKYARWEAQQRDFPRMRAVLERAVRFHGENPVLWRDYAELEASCGFVAHARAVWDRGVTALPSSAELWLKYLALEQAAGDDGRARDLFHRWLAVPAPPGCAFELLALFEAQRHRPDACRRVLQRHTAAAPSADAFLLRAAVERDVFGDASAAAAVLAEAEAALAPPVGDVEGGRLALARAEAHAAAGDAEAARAVYHRLLREHTDATGLDAALTAYAHFERMRGAGGVPSALGPHSSDAALHRPDGATPADAPAHTQSPSCGAGDAAALAMAEVMYRRRIARDPCDYDACAALYCLLRDRPSPVEAAAPMRVLAAAAERRIAEDPSPVSAQRHAVLAMTYARRLAPRDPTAAVALLAACVRDFPFARAECPRLYLEAAALEARHGRLSQSRALLDAALRLAPSRRIVDAALRLDRRDAVRCRAVLQTALRHAPDDAALWEELARLEERMAQPHRADAVRAAAIAAMSAPARETASMARRYELLGRVDRMWAKRLAAARRADPTASATVRRALLDSVWAEYRHDARQWRAALRDGVLSEPPLRPPEALAPGIARWAQAAAAAADAPNETREAFREMVERERAALRHELGADGEAGGEAEVAAGFEVAQRARRWAEFFLAPLIAEWRRFEATHGTQADLEAVDAFVQPVKRRTRLFARRNQ